MLVRDFIDLIPSLSHDNSAESSFRSTNLKIARFTSTGTTASWPWISQKGIIVIAPCFLVSHILQRNSFSPLNLMRKFVTTNTKQYPFKDGGCTWSMKSSPPTSEWPRPSNRMQHDSKHQLNILELLAIFIPFVVPETIGNNNRPTSPSRTSIHP